MGEGAYIRRWEQTKEATVSIHLWQHHHCPHFKLDYRKSARQRVISLMVAGVLFAYVFELNWEAGESVLSNLGYWALVAWLLWICWELKYVVQGISWRDRCDQAYRSYVLDRWRAVSDKDIGFGVISLTLGDGELCVTYEALGERHIIPCKIVDSVQRIEDQIALINGNLLRATVPLSAFEDGTDAAWFIGQLGDGTLTLPDDEGMPIHR